MKPSSFNKEASFGKNQRYQVFVLFVCFLGGGVSFAKVGKPSRYLSSLLCC